MCVGGKLYLTRDFGERGVRSCGWVDCVFVTALDTTHIKIRMLIRGIKRMALFLCLWIVNKILKSREAEANKSNNKCKLRNNKLDKQSGEAPFRLSSTPHGVELGWGSGGLLAFAQDGGRLLCMFLVNGYDYGGLLPIQDCLLLNAVFVFWQMSKIHIHRSYFYICILK